MQTPPHTLTVNDAFFQPLAGLAAASSNTYPCPEFSDDQWLRVGIQRVLEPVTSGRAFLQEHGPRFLQPPGRAIYFYSLHSSRRCDLARDVNLALIASGDWHDRLAQIPELEKYQ